MATQITRYLVCDRCDRSLKGEPDVRTKKLCRIGRSQGWITGKHFDICPSCVRSARALPDTPEHALRVAVAEAADAEISYSADKPDEFMAVVPVDTATAEQVQAAHPELLGALRLVKTLTSADEIYPDLVHTGYVFA